MFLVFQSLYLLYFVALFDYIQKQLLVFSFVISCFVVYLLVLFRLFAIMFVYALCCLLFCCFVLLFGLYVDCCVMIVSCCWSRGLSRCCFFDYD